MFLIIKFSLVIIFTLPFSTNNKEMVNNIDNIIWYFEFVPLMQTQKNCRDVMRFINKYIMVVYKTYINNLDEIKVHIIYSSWHIIATYVLYSIWKVINSQWSNVSVYHFLHYKHLLPKLFDVCKLLIINSVSHWYLLLIDIFFEIIKRTITYVIKLIHK